MIYYSHQTIADDDIEALVSAARSFHLTQGPRVEIFERHLAEYCGARYAIALANGTAALHLAYLAAGLNSGDELITSPISFLATANAALYCGAKPVFTDVLPEFPLIDPQCVEKRLTSRTRVIVTVDFAGFPVDYTRFLQLARESETVLIADAAHALGAVYRGQRVGSLADMTVFSFHPVKSITTGEGGMILTDSPEYAERLRLLRSHGATKESRRLESCSPGPWYYEMQELGYNYRITDFQCALGISQMQKLERFIHRRSMLAQRYRDQLQGIEGFIMPPSVNHLEDSNDRSAWHLFSLQIEFQRFGITRAELFEIFEKQGITLQVHYIPIPMQPYYRRLGYNVQDYPNALRYYNQAISLPLYPQLTENEQDRVIQLLRHCFS